MKSLQKIKNKLYCLKPQHINQPIFQLCTSQKCNNNQLCCFLCEQQNHKSHDMINIKIFISKINQLSIFQGQSLTLSAIFDNKVNMILNIINDNKAQLNDQNQVINAIAEYFENKKKMMLSLFEIPNKFQQISNLSIDQFQKQFIKFYQRYEFYFDFDQRQKQKQKANAGIYINNLNRFVEQIQTTLLTLQKYTKQGKFNDLQILLLFPLNQVYSKQFRPYFTQAFKGPCMKITSTTAEMQTSGSQRILALQPCLQTNTKNKKWKIKITKLVSWIGVGVCHINKLKEANWNFNYSTTQHGSYFISSNGYSWSSYKPQYNSKFQSFSFKTGDIINLQYNPKEKKLVFTKQDNNQTYMLEIQNNGDPVYPAVNLTGINDAVQIIY